MSVKWFSSTTTNAARDAARLYFEPIAKLSRLKRPRQKMSSASSLSKVIAADVTYSDVSHLRELRAFQKQLRKRIEIEISFAKEDLLYAELLKETLESKNVVAYLSKSWAKHLPEAPSRHIDFEIVIWSQNFASKSWAVNKLLAQGRNIPFVALRVDDAVVPTAFDVFSKEIDVSTSTVADAASSALARVLEILRQRSERASGQT